MDKTILENLRKWRDRTAKREHVEMYRVLGNQALEEIAQKLPQNKEALLEIKGIKEKKYARYGEDILEIVRGDRQEFTEKFKEKERVFEVSQYLDVLNDKLSESEARVKGEVSSLENRGNYVFFGIKDKNDESLLNCFIWQEDYLVSGLELQEGMEVVIWGYPNIFKPSGRLSFQTKLIELVGEGLLKKAYEELKRKLESEGIFAPERKKSLPEYARYIGLITSHQGAAIGDFSSNVGNYGYRIKFFDSRVEGKQAVFDLISGLKWFNENIPDLDIIVMVRGGGSLESLQAFNTEALVREIADSKIPILAGIGHEKDVSLAALAADKMVSTPTAAALEIRQVWDEAIHKIERNEKIILNLFAGALEQQKFKLINLERNLTKGFLAIYDYFDKLKNSIQNGIDRIKMVLKISRENLAGLTKKIMSSFGSNLKLADENIKNILKTLESHNPERQLKLGYSLVSLEGKIVRSVKDVKTGDNIGIQVSDGKFESEVKKI